MIAFYEIKMSKSRKFFHTLAAYVCMTEVEIHGKVSERSPSPTTKLISTKDKKENGRSMKAIKGKDSP